MKCAWSAKPQSMRKNDRSGIMTGERREYFAGRATAAGVVNLDIDTTTAKPYVFYEVAIPPIR